ncbi:MAG: hypothetical protein ACRDTU_14750 [Micromonosporaceae bacterium]
MYVGVAGTGASGGARNTADRLASWLHLPPEQVAGATLKPVTAFVEKRAT